MSCPVLWHFHPVLSCNIVDKNPFYSLSCGILGDFHSVLPGTECYFSLIKVSLSQRRDTRRPRHGEWSLTKVTRSDRAVDGPLRLLSAAPLPASQSRADQGRASSGGGGRGARVSWKGMRDPTRPSRRGRPLLTLQSTLRGAR